ncbi:MAG: AMP-binding protein [Methylococcales bacterium]
MSNNPKTESFNDLASADSGSCFSFANGKKISLGELFSQAQRVASGLPQASYAINLCQDRYLFTVAFLAVILREQINLLPQNRSPGCVENLLENHSASYCISDEPDLPFSGVRITLPDSTPEARETIPRIQKDRIACISFTSGSTGEPKSIAKTFGEFSCCARLATQRLGIGPKVLLVSTVPPQHTYGLETSVFWPLVSGAAIHSGRPFFPEDIRRTVCDSKQPCFLISTPTQLKACVESSLCWTNLAGVLSSTAAMPLKLAEAIEQTFAVSLFEVFGSTETLSFASRRLCVSEKWQPYDGVEPSPESEGFRVSGGHLQTAIRLDDRVEIDPRGFFTLTGRSSDLVKIGGKRASLTELNRLINEIEGVRDAVFYPTGNGRLGALVVSRRSKESILAELRQSIDEVFLPRPLHLVQTIPRNELGKIVKWKLDQLTGALDIG